MKKLTYRLSFLVAGLGMLLTSGPLKGSLQDIIDPFVDPIKYEKPVAEAYEEPVEKEELKADVDVNSIKKVIINYYNDDKKNSTRAIYTWTTGTDSILSNMILDTAEYAHIELDYTGNAIAYAGKSFLNFIVRYQASWTGQSLDVLLDFNEFGPDDNGVVEIWTCPGDGGSIEIYKTKAETQMEKVRLAYFTGWKTIRCEADVTPKLYRLYAYDKAYLASTDAVQERTQYLRLLKEGVPTSKNFNITFNHIAHLNVQYVVETEYTQHIKIQRKIVTAYKLYDDTNFNRYYTYSGNDLGVTYTPEATTFKVWAPTAGAVILNVYNVGTPKGVISVGGGGTGSNIHKSYFMTMQPGGVWVKTLTTESATLEGKYYTYTVYNSEGCNEVVDPYAKSCGVNGMRGMILDFSRTNPEGWDENLPRRWDGVSGFDIKTPQELSIYEIHIRDLTEDESWNGTATPGSFQAFYEKGTRLKDHPDVTTGFDHVEELGVTAIQIVPVYDHDNNELFFYYNKDKTTGEETEQQMFVSRSYQGDRKDDLHLEYNWGYNPLNYNCVEGQYCSNPEDGAVRVQEFKQLIYNYGTNKNHTRVVMDVVYNHVSSVANSCFTKLMPRYYFRFNEAKDEYWNGSDCSNEVKTEAKMMRKFIVDSLCWWASEYKIKGFRFDLMGLIDVDTLNEARAALYKIDPDIYMYGEGWKAFSESGLDPSKRGDTYHVYTECKPAANKVVLGCFNDAGRDELRGGNDGGMGSGNRHPGYGFMSQGASDVGSKANTVRSMLDGYNGWQSVSMDRKQTVNYAACHDNFTLYDQFSWTLSDSGGSETEPSAAPSTVSILQAVTACNMTVMLSTGAAFMLGGDELFRTKVEDQPLKSRLDEDYVKQYGKDISHNSYKSSPSTNSFKWDRKVSVTGYKGFPVAQSTLKTYFNALKKAIEIRKDIAKGVTGFTTDHNSNDDYNTTKVSFWIKGASGGYKLFLSGRGVTEAASMKITSNASQQAKIGSVNPGTATGGYKPVSMGKYACAIYKE